MMVSCVGWQEGFVGVFLTYGWWEHAYWGLCYAVGWVRKGGKRKRKESKGAGEARRGRACAGRQAMGPSRTVVASARG